MTNYHTGSTASICRTNPALNYDSISIADGAVTLTFEAQSSDVAVKVRVS